MATNASPRTTAANRRCANTRSLGPATSVVHSPTRSGGKRRRKRDRDGRNPQAVSRPWLPESRTGIRSAVGGDDAVNQRSSFVGAPAPTPGLLLELAVGPEQKSGCCSSRRTTCPPTRQWGSVAGDQDCASRRGRVGLIPGSRWPNVSEAAAACWTDPRHRDGFRTAPRRSCCMRRAMHRGHRYLRFAVIDCDPAVSPARDRRRAMHSMSPSDFGPCWRATTERDRSRRAGHGGSQEVIWTSERKGP